MIVSIGYKFKHVKSGHVVTVLRLGWLQSEVRHSSVPHVLVDMEPMVVYEHEGVCWVRSLEDFSDGRFERA
jgi:hypothetical protein